MDVTISWMKSNDERADQVFDMETEQKELMQLIWNLMAQGITFQQFYG